MSLLILLIGNTLLLLGLCMYIYKGHTCGEPNDLGAGRWIALIGLCLFIFGAIGLFIQQNTQIYQYVMELKNH